MFVLLVRGHPKFIPFFQNFLLKRSKVNRKFILTFTFTYICFLFFMQNSGARIVTFSSDEIQYPDTFRYVYY